jgi:Tfp pilus assembly protein PilN
MSTNDGILPATAAPTRPTRAKRAPKADRGPTNSGSTKGRKTPEASIVGLEPRVDLLPREVHVDRQQRAGVRRAWMGVVVVAALVAIGTGAAMSQSLGAASDLEAAQSQTNTLLAQKRQFSELQGTVNDTARLRAAQKVAGSTEIDWSDYLDKVQKSLPSGVTITTVGADSASATAPYGQGTSALQGERIATITFTATSSTLPRVPDWLDSLKKLPGFVDGTANSVTLSDDGGSTYTASLTLHINEDAYDDRYSSKEK